jgi:hypothetical protein
LTSEILALFETLGIVGLRRHFFIVGLICAEDDDIFRSQLHLFLPVAHQDVFQRLAERWLTFERPDRVAMGASLEAGSVPGAGLLPEQLGDVSSLSSGGASGLAGNGSAEGVVAEANQEDETDLRPTNVADCHDPSDAGTG